MSGTATSPDRAGAKPVASVGRISTVAASNTGWGSGGGNEARVVAEMKPVEGACRAALKFLRCLDDGVGSDLLVEVLAFVPPHDAERPHRRWQGGGVGMDVNNFA